MEDYIIESFGRGDWVDRTTIHPLGIILVILCSISVLMLRRQNVIWPLLITVLFISPAQRIVLMSLDFNMLRIMVIVGLLRIILKNEYRNHKPHIIDKILVLYVISRISIHFLRDPTASVLIGEVGLGYDAIGLYFLFRFLVTSWGDVNRIIHAIIILSIPMALLFSIEYSTGRNMFSIFGGVPEITQIRDGKLRCQGAFPHPIIAGCFWAAILPLIVSRLWNNRISKNLTWAGIICVSWIIITTSSSTPIFGVLSAVIAGLMFKMRYRMAFINMMLITCLAALHMVMNAPVWHLISRVSAVSGSTSYFRYMLIDAFINNINEWWLLGINTTAHWFPGAYDLTNQYVLEGVNGGLLTLVLFLTIIAIAFRSVGRIWRREKNSKRNLALSWALGVSLFVHCVNFIGVSYFGQIVIAWYMILALIANIDIHTTNSSQKERTPI